jgi:flagellar biosynthesis/type III secretory pathway protein FliH
MGVVSRATTQQHLYQTCQDDGCQRFGCRVYKEGRRNGYEEGNAEGYAKGHAEEYAAGWAAGYSAGVAAASE